MIPRHQTVLFVILLAASMVMGGVLWHLRDRAHQRLLAGEDSAPTRAPEVAPPEQATLMVADDQDDSLETRILSLPLPPGASGRGRAVLGELLDLYAAPHAAHPVPGGAQSIAGIFLLPAVDQSRPSGPQSSAKTGSGDQLAVVNLTGAFARSHPSGIETETLTILSICATLHANLPQVTQVRFLVDGQPRATLAGHADLTRIYLTSETTTNDPTSEESGQGANP